MVFVLLVSLSTVATGGPGSADEPVRYVGNEWANVESHDGRLRPAVGVQSCEVMHCNRTHPELADNYGWTYNHGPNIAYWNGRVALTFNEGLSWTDPVVCPTISDNSSKHWGRRTDDGRYAMLYNPDERRFPLMIVTGEDGILFDNKIVVNGEVPGRRFRGRWKDVGNHYVRGIVEGTGDPPAMICG